MALTQEQKAELIKKFATGPKDTASPQVQIALLTKRLDALNDHFKDNKKDAHSRMGLLKLVGRRRRLLKYLQEHNEGAYKQLIVDLGIRK
jgi:small subunit ribosomal protein S15